MPNPGDKVTITTRDTSESGILIPSPDKDVLILKLESGYNMGFAKSDVTNIQVVESMPVQEHQPHKIEQNPHLPTISILHTGGTIASKVDYRTGGVASEFTPQDLLALFPELQSIANVKSELIAQMWSDDFRFTHFKLIAQKIEEQIDKGVKGIIIGSGTDNLSVLAAALSFIVESTPIPIIIVGAQRSSDRGSSDAAMNVICAAKFITKTDFGGVAICMHEGSSDEWCSILPATKTRKLHSSRRDAFKVVNDTPIARVNYKTGDVEFCKQDYSKKEQTLTLKPEMEEKVGLLKIHVNMFPDQFRFFKGYKGLVIEGTGLGLTPGQVPNELCVIHKDIYPAIKEVIDSGCVVVMTTQCLFGPVNMNVYSKGRDLLNLGLIPTVNTLPNTALVKLSWLLANYSKDEVEQKMQQNLRGEINEQLKYENNFL